jgi:hypothetical protein
MLQSVLKALEKVDVLLNNAAGNFISPTNGYQQMPLTIIVLLKGQKTVLSRFW